MDTNEGEVYFALNGDNFDPEEMTKFLGIQPTSISIKGIPIPKQSSSKISSGKIINECIDVYGMASSLIDILEPKEELLIEAIKHFNVKPHLEVVLWFTVNEDIFNSSYWFR